MSEPTGTLEGQISEEERGRRIEAAIHAKLESIAAAHEDKILEGVAEMIARFEQPDTSRVPEILNRSGEVVHRQTSPTQREYRRLSEEERQYRNPDKDHWYREWFKGFQTNDRPTMMLAQDKMMTLNPQLRADTLEGAASAAGGFAAGTGGTLLPRPLEALVEIVRDRIAKMQRFATTYTMTAQEHNIPTANAVTAFMVGEATSPITQGEPTFAQVPLIAHDAMAKLILGRNLMDDAAVNVINIVVNRAGRALAVLEDAEFFRLGTGTAPHPTKLTGTLYLEQTSTFLAYSDVVKMYTSLQQEYRDGARWFISPNVIQLMSNVRDGIGRLLYSNLFDPPLVLNDDPGAIGTLLGRPVHETVLTSGELWFGDPSACYAIGRRRGITVEMSRDFLFDTRRVIWLVSQRIAGNNIDIAAAQYCQGITAATSL